MYKHTVMWDFNDIENKLELAKSYKEEIEALVGIVPGLISCKANYNMVEGSTSSMYLECIFETYEDLKNYRTNPFHRAVGDKYRLKLLINKKVADFEI